MIRKVQIENFMSLKNTTIDLNPFTIFIGPNASGKSAIFKALVTLSKLIGSFPVSGPEGEFTTEPAVTLDYLVWQGNSGLPIKYRLWLTDSTDSDPDYTLELQKEARGWSVTKEIMKLNGEWFDSSQQSFEHQTERLGIKKWTSPYRATLFYLVNPFRNDQLAAPTIAPLFQLRERIGDIWRYRISASDIGDFAKTKKEQRFYVGENGWGLSIALQRLQGVNRKLFEAIEKDLSDIFPHIKFINFQSERFGVGLAFTTDRSEDLVPASQESDGVLLTLFLLWRLWTAPNNFEICLEEPENGVHPYLLGERFRLIKDFTDNNRGGKPTQVLIATHSPDFLSSIEDDNDIFEKIRVVEFDTEEGTKVYNLKDMKQVDTLLNTFKHNLGDLWWSGAIGAVPSSHDFQD